MIITGGLISPKDKSFINLFKKQFSQWKMSKHQWLELKIKTLLAEPYLIIENEKKRYLKTGCNDKLKSIIKAEDNFETVELTEVALATLLKKESIEYELATYDDTFDSKSNFEKKLQQCDVIFFSTTFIRDLSELLPIISKVKKSKHKVIVGGALMGILKDDWHPPSYIDVVAIGYGEFLIPCLADWIKSDFKKISPPKNGKVSIKEKCYFVFSGTPLNQSLDFIVKPDWKQNQVDRRQNYRMISYESVRGCPYRCSFCNYPYLFDDTKFRMKSAEKMAKDWLEYSQELNAEYITCLDSLFTLPKSRLIEFCYHLINQGNRFKWICYARADDLADEEVVSLMVKAGVVQVQIGLETGDDRLLKNMSKNTTVEMNSKALINCRKYGLTTVATLIVGFPGETRDSLRRTYEFMKSSPPDFFFIATFSTRVAGVPILNDENKSKFSLVTMENYFTSSPYWKHFSMDCLNAANESRWLLNMLVENKISIDAISFYKNILKFNPEVRAEILELQKRGYNRLKVIRKLFSLLHWSVDFFLRRDLKKVLGNEEKGMKKINSLQTADAY